MHPGQHQQRQGSCPDRCSDTPVWTRPSVRRAMHACMHRRHAEPGLRWNDDMNKYDEQARRRGARGRAMNKTNKHIRPQRDDGVDEGQGGIRDIPSAWRRASRYGTRPRKRPMAAGAKLRTRRARTHSEAWASSSRTRIPDEPMGRSRAQRRAGLLYSLVLSCEVRSTSSGQGKDYGKGGETASAAT